MGAPELVSTVSIPGAISNPGAISALSLTAGGTLYAIASFSQVPLTGGSGTGATADITVSAGGIITSVVLRSGGNGYLVGDVLSATVANLGGGTGSGFQTTVSSVVVDVESAVNIATSARIAAGNLNPRSALDVQNEAAIFGGNSIVAYNNFSASSVFAAGAVSVSAGTAVTGSGTKFTSQLQVGSSISFTTTAGAEVRVVASITDDLNLVVTSAFAGSATNVIWAFTYPRYPFLAWARIAIDPTIFVVPTNLSSHVISGSAYYDATNLTSGSLRYMYGGIVVKNLAAGWTGSAQFIGGGVNRTEPTDLATTGSWFGSSLNMSVNAACGSNTTAGMTCYGGSVNNNKSGHTITTGTVYNSTGSTVAGSTVTTFYNYNAQLTNNGAITTSYGLRLQAPTGTGTITNRWGVSQEDASANNVFSGKAVVGAAAGTTPVAGSTLDVRGVIDVSGSATNGVTFYNRGGAGISTTKQSYYEEGSYTPTSSAGYTGTLTGTWTRVGRRVMVTIQSTGAPNGVAVATTFTLPAGLVPVRNAAGLRVKVTGSALGNGVVAVEAATGVINVNTAITVDNDAKIIQVEYEV